MTASYRVCPGCGARNKLKWEDCVRCGEVLSDVAVAKDAAPAKEALRASRAPAVAPSPVSPVALVILVGAGFLAFAFYGKQPTLPAADAFTIPTRPPAPASKPPEAPLPAGSSAFNEGRRLLLQGQFAEAARLLGEAVAQAPAEPLYRGYYAKALWHSGARDQALREYDAAVQLSPASVEYRNERALAYMTLDRREEAAREFELVLAADPNRMEALRALAQLKSAQGDAQASVALLTRALRLRAGDPEIVQDLAYAFEKSGQLDQASTYYEAILARLPDAQVSRSRYAETLLARNRPDEALAVLQDGITRAPSAPLLRRSLGSVLERTGRVPEAIAAYREYVRLAPNAPDAARLAARADGLERRLRSAPAAQEARATS